MTYTECIDIILNKRRFGKKTGREITEELMKRFFNPCTSFETIHIAGTNGKGSTCVLVSSVLMGLGHKVGLFTSPHLIKFNERIKVNGEEISDEDVLRLGEHVLNELSTADIEATMFDICLAIAMLYFKEKGCDVVVLETGLGGEFDSTRGLIQTPKVCGLSNIGIDHERVLGSDISSIARTKSEILRSGCYAVIGYMPSDAVSIIENKCLELNNEFYTLSEHNNKYSDYKSPLRGTFQNENLSLALHIVEAFETGECIEDRDVFLGDKSTIIKLALNGVTHSGRVETLSDNPLFIIDGAHNPQGAKALYDTLVDIYPKEKFVFVIGVMEDKDYTPMIKQMMDISECFVCASVGEDRALDSQVLKKDIIEIGASAYSVSSVDEAIELAKKILDTNAMIRGIVAYGSIHFVGDIKKRWT